MTISDDDLAEIVGQIVDPELGRDLRTCLLYTSPSPRDA